MKKLICLLCLFFAATLASANPFLVCDPQAGVDTYNVYQDDALIASDVPAESDGSIKYDLKDITPGAYNWDVEACNDWGCEKTVDPYLSDTAIQNPENLRLSK